MDPQLSTVMVAVLIAPFILFGIAALGADLSQSRRDRRERVIASWGELRITESFLIVGYHRNAQRIPLAGLTVRVTETGSPADGPGGHLVHVTVAGAGAESVQQSQPHSVGSLTGARMFEILFNRTAPAPVAPVAAAVEAPAVRWAA
ncbi:hypothetical protein FHT40_005475 [Mycolicibacterium sp. BK556]|uniref:hypothetical protein n=1 Tax=unclassified Mycolicibacterium TaxID=2636767 RepID=UPI00160E2CC5|nr:MULTISPECIES: hypothetical protein [unclassified Mycolicibacterium]MBB3605788.1 hypothetical protein [Mycolicibacterium sp. BK556]MBB3635715.1 hypothetical protein [Mycolicibacterium sp. BK607]